MRYVISTATADSSLALENAFKASGIWVSTQYRTVNTWLICTLSCSNKIIKIDTSIFAWYFGDAWTSGSTITNQKTILTGGGGKPSRSLLYVTPDYVVAFADTSMCAIFGKLANGKQFVGSLATNSGWCNPFYNTTDNNSNYFPVNTFQDTVIDKNGNYYTAPLILKDNNGLLYDSPFLGIDVIGKAADTWLPTHLDKDVTIPIRYLGGTYYTFSFLLRNALL